MSTKTQMVAPGPLDPQSPLDRVNATLVPIAVTIERAWKNIPAQLAKLASTIGEAPVISGDARREELRRSARMLGYAGFSREAAKRYAQSQYGVAA